MAAVPSHWPRAYQQRCVTLHRPPAQRRSCFSAARPWVSRPPSSERLPRHKQRVSEIQDQVLCWKKKGSQRRLCTARGGWQSISPGYRAYKKKSTKISINLYDILELNEAKATLRVEPMVNMGMITHYLTPKGLTLPVLPEMDDLTVGKPSVLLPGRASAHTPRAVAAATCPTAAQPPTSSEAAPPRIHAPGRACGALRPSATPLHTYDAASNPQGKTV